MNVNMHRCASMKCSSFSLGFHTEVLECGVISSSVFIVFFLNEPIIFLELLEIFSRECRVSSDYQSTTASYYYKGGGYTVYV
jgi:hypothetical protein